MSTFKSNSVLCNSTRIVPPYSLNILYLAVMSGLIFSTSSYADESINTSAMQLPVINVQAVDEDIDPLKLKQVNTTASQLGLTAKETPATLQTITQQEIQQKGIRTTKEAFSEITGATVGNVCQEILL